jgi:hypothetical protein
MGEREGTPEEFAAMFGARPEAEPTKDEPEPKGELESESDSPTGGTQPAKSSDPAEDHNRLLRQLLGGPVSLEEPTGKGDW